MNSMLFLDPKSGLGKAKITLLCLSVMLARNEYETVPPGFQTFYPSPSLSIENFICFPLPTSSYALSSYSSSKWFSNEKPKTWTFGELKKLLYSRSLPTPQELKRLHQDFGQQWLNGAQSICDPRINSGKDHLPLWFWTVWWDMKHYVEVQASLKKAREAVTNLIAEDASVQAKFPTVHSVFRDLKWDQMSTPMKKNLIRIILFMMILLLFIPPKNYSSLLPQRKLRMLSRNRPQRSKHISWLYQMPPFCSMSMINEECESINITTASFLTTRLSVTCLRK